MNTEDTIVNHLIPLANVNRCGAIAVCGAADLGKSYLSKSIVERLKARGVTAGHLPLDSFLMKRSERIKRGISGYQSDAYDVDSVKTMIENFCNGSQLSFAPYNHTTGETANKRITLENSSLLIVDGLHSMHPVLKPYIRFSLFIYTDDDQLRKIRKEADRVKRKQTTDISDALEPLEFERYKQLVEPYKNGKRSQG